MMNRQGTAKIFKQLAASVRKHSPAVLTGIGIAGMVTAAVLAVKATPKAMRLMEAKKQEQQKETLTAAETVKAAWHCYIPAAVTMTVSAACLIGASALNAKHRAALAMAYTLSETARVEYADKVQQIFGEEKEQEIRDAVAKDKIDSHPVQSSEVIITEHGTTLCYDALSGRYFRSDIEKLRKAENELNHAMLNYTYASLNDFYCAIGLDDIQLGDELGWSIHKGMMQLAFSSQLTPDGVPCIVVGYTTPPYYDYT